MKERDARTVRGRVLGMALGWLLGATGCGPEPSGGRGGGAPSQVHSTTGLVREIAPDRRTATIRHEAIPGYMPRMTMELTVRDTNELAGIQVGDVVSFRLLATDETHWIDTVRRVYGTNAGAGLVQAAPVVAPEERARVLSAGDVVPDVPLMDENGRALRFSDLRGQVVAFTFIFTRCPLPDFCPRMNKQLADARRLLRADAGAPTNWLLLSISFDPKFDKPAVLKTYANTYREGDARNWLFAAAEEQPLLRTLAPVLDLRLAWEGGSISHNLRTVVIDAEGRVFRQLNGNVWSAADLTNAIASAVGAR